MKERLYRKIVAAVPMLKPLERKELDEILSISRLIKVPHSAKVISEGEQGTAMYIIVAGQVQIKKRLEPQGEANLATLGPGEVFGEMALLDRFPRSATARTLTDAVLYQIDLERFNTLRSNYRPVAFKILKQTAPILCKRLRAINSTTERMLTSVQDHEA